MLTIRALKPPGARMTKKSPGESDASKSLTRRIEELGDWRGEMLAWVRQRIHDVVPSVIEEWKWRGTPVWSHDGGICTGEPYKEVVKLTFFRGAALPDPSKLFNSSLDGNVRRAIDIREGAKVNEAAFKALIQAAVGANTAFVTERAAKKSAPKAIPKAVKGAPRKAAPKADKETAKKALPKKSASRKKSLAPKGA